MNEIIPFYKKLRETLREKGISIRTFEEETGICRKILYNERRIHKSMLMGISYYLDMNVEDLVEGTTAMDYWYR